MELRELLKSGRIIELRNGRKYLICGNVLMGTEGYLTTPAYNKNLQEINDGDEEWDIMRIYNPIRVSLQEVFKGLEKAEVIWSRPKERPSNLKSLLQTGMRVTTRDGDTYIVLRRPAETNDYELILSNKENCLNGYRYNNSLQHEAYNGYDIIKIEQVFSDSLSAMLTGAAWEVIYEEK